MIASIGPFWDANETWLVLGVGILLIAFPKAHGMVLTALYLPVALMLIGLILRGVAFDFRVKATPSTSRCGTARSSPAPARRACRRAGCSAATSPASPKGSSTPCSPRPSPCCCPRPTCCWAPPG
jgi:hypothetical protein